MNFLKAMCVNYQRLLRKLDRKLADKESFCTKCRQTLNNTVVYHKNNQAHPSQFAEQPVQQIADVPQPMRFENEEFDPTSLKRQKKQSNVVSTDDSSKGK